MIGREEIVEIIRKEIINVIDGISPEVITIEKRLKDLGADSIDRVDIMSKTLEVLGLTIPLVELGRAKNIRDLVDILCEKVS